MNPRRVIVGLLPRGVIGRARDVRRFWLISQSRRLIRAEDVDYRSLLRAPAAADSAETGLEVLEVLRLQETRTPGEMERAAREAIISPGLFGEAIGGWFNARTLPRTFAFLQRLIVADGAVVEPIKAFYARKRPYEIDGRVQSCVPLERTPGYPSGHAARALILAGALAEIFPESKERLHALAGGIPERRVKAGVHFPSDIEAGKVLGAHIFQKMKQSRVFQSQVARADRECQPYRAAAGLRGEFS